MESRRIRLWLLLLGGVAASALLWVGIRRLCSNEITGLDYIGPVIRTHFGYVPGPSGPGIAEVESTVYDRETTAHDYAESVESFNEQPLDAVVDQVGARVYRFHYIVGVSPSVCITAWEDGDQHWVRTSVVHWDGSTYQHFLWRKTRPLSAQKWDRLRALFKKQSVTHPLNAMVPSRGGPDGSDWYLGALVSGRTTLVEVSNPVRSFGPHLPGFQIVKPRESSLEDFVSTCRFMLHCADVQVPWMH